MKMYLVVSRPLTSHPYNAETEHTGVFASQAAFHKGGASH